MTTTTRRTAILWASWILTGVLAACGGGGADNGCTTLDPNRNPNLPSCTASASPGAPAAIAPLALGLSDASGAALVAVSPQRPGVVQALVRDGSGGPLANVAVSFSTTDKTAALVPSSGTALTDSAGVARVGLPAGSQSGAFTLTATASKGSASATGSKATA